MKRAAIFLLVLSLVACSLGEPLVTLAEEESLSAEIDPGVLTGLFREVLIEEDMGNCPIDEFKVPGEGVRLKGGTGGFLTAFTPMPGDVYAAGQHVANLASPSFTDRSAILIVDDFDQDLNPGVYLPDAGGGGSHGALVFNHTLALLSTLNPIGNPARQIDPFTVNEPAPEMPFEFEAFGLPSVTFPKLGVTVAAVDTDDFNTDAIAGRIAATIHALSQGGVSRFAVNLSFGLVPCSVLEDFGAAKDEFSTFEAYRDAILRKNGYDPHSPKVERFRKELTQILTVSVGGAPLRQLSQFGPNAFGKVERIAYLASAGNYKMEDSLYPGRWAEFASVSASVLETRSIKKNTPYLLKTRNKDYTYSNTGEVLLPGGYYQFTRYDAKQGRWVSNPKLGFAGTSFAAPMLSVFTALDYTSHTPRCKVARHGGTPLAFYDPATSAPPLNQPLEDALNVYCP